MNKDRLDLIISLISSQSVGIADVGTDHGYIPVAMASSGFKGNIFATDINSQPLSKAVSYAERMNVSDRICFIRSDGLVSVPPDKLDTIIIAGMGGDTICSIIDRSEWTMNNYYKLILQPMTKHEVLRYWLTNNGYGIEAEHIDFSNGRYNQIIVSRFTDKNTDMSTAELFCGYSDAVVDRELYRALLNKETAIFEDSFKSISSTESVCSRKKGFYETVLSELKECFYGKE